MMHRNKRARLAASGILAVTFASGLALGFALDRSVAQAAPEEVETEEPERDRRPSPPSGWIIDHLDLTEEQQARVDSVIEHYGAYMAELQREYRPRFREVVDSTRQAMREVLSEEQVERYEAMEEEIDRRRRGGGGRR